MQYNKTIDVEEGEVQIKKKTYCHPFGFIHPPPTAGGRVKEFTFQTKPEFRGRGGVLTPPERDRVGIISSHPLCMPMMHTGKVQYIEKRHISTMNIKLNYEPLLCEKK